MEGMKTLSTLFQARNEIKKLECDDSAENFPQSHFFFFGSPLHFFIIKSSFLQRFDSWNRCYDFLNILAEKFGENFGEKFGENFAIFDSNRAKLC
jgi:hypothetical protein